MNVDQAIAAAARHHIRLDPENIKGTYWHPTIDGMDAGEWLEAMTMD